MSNPSATRFATIDLSDPVYEWGGLRFLTFKSQVLRGRGDITLYVPPDVPDAASLPIVVLLHGVYDQFAIFSRQPLSTYSLANDEDKSVLHWLLANRDRLPPLRFDCGDTDLLIAYNRELHQALLDNGVAHQYEEFPGGHSWAYWAEHIKDSLRFFGGILNQ